MSGLLLATDSSTDAFDAVRLFAQMIEMDRIRRIHVLSLAWPVDFCEPIPLIGEPELERLGRILYVLTETGAFIEAERASGTNARDVLAAAEVIDASMIVLALSYAIGQQDRTDEFLAKLIDNSPLAVLRLPWRHSASQDR